MSGIVFYARGGGTGHSTRAISIARFMRDARPVVLHDSIWIDPFDIEGIDQQRAVGLDVTAWLEQRDPDVLVIDTFPLGSNGELTNYLFKFSGRKVLIYRHSKQRISSEVLSMFDKVLISEPDGTVGTPVWPILQRDPSELTIDTSGGRLVIPQRSRPSDRKCWPVMERMAKASLIVGPASYLMFWASKALQKETQFTAVHQAFDDQQWRISTFGALNGPLTNKAPLAAAEIVDLMPPRSVIPDDVQPDPVGVYKYESEPETQAKMFTARGATDDYSGRVAFELPRGHFSAVHSAVPVVVSSELSKASAMVVSMTISHIVVRVFDLEGVVEPGIAVTLTVFGV